MATKTVLIGSARIDENGKARGGKAGDQNGNEVSTQAWYKHKKKWVVLRPISRELGQKIAYDMQAACDNPHIGYDQGQRLTLYNAAKSVDFDCARVTTNVETDCSALVRVCCAYAGIMVSNFTTSNEASILMNSGYFVKFTDSKYTDSPDYLRAGDILVTKTQGHTVVVLNDGMFAGDEKDDDKVPSDDTDKDPVNDDGLAIVTGSYWLRKKPSITGEKITVLYAGTVVRIYGEKDGWYGVKVVKTGEKGYVSKKAFT